MVSRFVSHTIRVTTRLGLPDRTSIFSLSRVPSRSAPATGGECVIKPYYFTLGLVFDSIRYNPKTGNGGTDS
jgi:hypothetical protein